MKLNKSYSLAIAMLFLSTQLCFAVNDAVATNVTEDHQEKNETTSASITKNVDAEESIAVIQDAMKNIPLIDAIPQAPKIIQQENAVENNIQADEKLRSEDYVDLVEEISNEAYDEPLDEAILIDEKTKKPSILPITAKGIQLPDYKAEGITYLTEYLDPWKEISPEERFDVQFDNADLLYFLKYLENIFKIAFILDDDIKPPSPNALQVQGNKITFKTQVPLSAKEIWDVAQTFLSMANLAIVPSNIPRTYRITIAAADANKPSANKEPLPTFIGVDYSLLPDSGKVRYVYLVENTDVQTIKSIIEAMRGPNSAPPIAIEPMRAIIITDNAPNIKSIMAIVRELDVVTMPETLSVIRLQQADAAKVVQLYKDLVNQQDNQPGYIFRPTKKTESTSYFNKSTRVIAEPRSNSLIVLGTREGIERFENFIIKHIDKQVDLPFSPLHIHQLKYLKAKEIATILNEVIQFQTNDPAAQFGGVRGGEKYFKMGTTITPEESGNRLIINASYDDYLKILEVIERMDVEQPQVAIRVLILNVDLTDQRQLGTQLRNKACFPDPASSDCTQNVNNCCGPDILGGNINFQSSTIFSAGIVQNNSGTGVTRLLGDLISLAQGAPAGSTLISLGKDMFGIFGLLRVLQTYTRASVIANPFVIATHKYKAQISVGETRRLPSAIVSGTGGNVEGFIDIQANLQVEVIPQISYVDEMVRLDIYVTVDQFIDDFGSRNDKQVRTNVLLANGEVIALGGLIRDTVSTIQAKVPILGDIPLLGWFFKSENKIVQKSSLLILLSPEIIKPHSQMVADSYTQSKINETKRAVFAGRDPYAKRDPIHRWFFAENKDSEPAQLDKFVAVQQKYLDESKKGTSAMVALSENRSQKNKKRSLLDFVDEEKGVMG